MSRPHPYHDSARQRTPRASRPWVREMETRPVTAKHPIRERSDEGRTPGSVLAPSCAPPLP